MQVFFKHPVRTCAYEEAEVCIEQMRDREEIIRAQMKKYKADGYPMNNGLAAATVVFRRHLNSDCIKFSNTWWEEIRNHSRRDQLSLNYSFWKNKLTYFEICEGLWSNSMFKINSHKKNIYV